MTRLSNLKSYEVSKLLRNLSLTAASKRKSDLTHSIELFLIDAKNKNNKVNFFTTRKLIELLEQDLELPEFQLLASQVSNSIKNNTTITYPLNDEEIPDREIVFKRSVYYDIIEKIEANGNNPFTIDRLVPVDEKKIVTHVERFRFSLTEKERKLLKTPNYILAALASPLDRFKDAKHIEFPTPCRILVNNVEVDANYKGIKGKKSSVIPVNLTPYVQKKGTNELMIKYSYAEYKYKFYFFIIRTNKVDLLVDQVVNLPHITADETIQMIKKQNENDDISTSKEISSLLCPCSFVRMKYPVRSVKCNHIQCFDLKYYLLLQEKAPVGTCPICTNKIKIKHLAIDDYFDSIIKNTSEQYDYVEIQNDGSYIPQRELNATINPSKINSNNLIMSSTKPNSNIKVKQEEDVIVNDIGKLILVDYDKSGKPIDVEVPNHFTKDNEVHHVISDNKSTISSQKPVLNTAPSTETHHIAKKPKPSIPVPNDVIEIISDDDEPMTSSTATTNVTNTRNETPIIPKPHSQSQHQAQQPHQPPHYHQQTLNNVLKNSNKATQSTAQQPIVSNPSSNVQTLPKSPVTVQASTLPTVIPVSSAPPASVVNLSPQNPFSSNSAPSFQNINESLASSVQHALTTQSVAPSSTVTAEAVPLTAPSSHQNDKYFIDKQIHERVKTLNKVTNQLESKMKDYERLKQLIQQSANEYAQIQLRISKAKSSISEKTSSVEQEKSKPTNSNEKFESVSKEMEHITKTFNSLNKMYQSYVHSDMNTRNTLFQKALDLKVNNLGFPDIMLNQYNDSSKSIYEFMAYAFSNCCLILKNVISREKRFCITIDRFMRAELKKLKPQTDIYNDYCLKLYFHDASFKVYSEFSKELDRLRNLPTNSTYLDKRIKLSNALLEVRHHLIDDFQNPSSSMFFKLSLIRLTKSLSGYGLTFNIISETDSQEIKKIRFLEEKLLEFDDRKFSTVLQGNIENVIPTNVSRNNSMNNATNKNHSNVQNVSNANVLNLNNMNNMNNINNAHVQNMNTPQTQNVDPSTSSLFPTINTATNTYSSNASNSSNTSQFHSSPSNANSGSFPANPINKIYEQYQAQDKIYKLEQKKIEDQRIEQEKRESAQQLLRDQMRMEQQKVEQNSLEKILEQKRVAQERIEHQRIEQQRAEQQRIEHQRIEQQRAEQQRIEQQRAEQQRAEQQRAEQQRAEQQRIEQQRIEQQRIEQQRAEQQRIEQQRAEQQRAEHQRIEQQRIEQQRIEQQRIEQQRIEQQRIEQQRIEKQRAKQQRIEQQQRAEQQRAQQQRIEQQRFEQQQRAEQQRAQQQRIEQQRFEQQQSMIMNSNPQSRVQNIYYNANANNPNEISNSMQNNNTKVYFKPNVQHFEVQNNSNSKRSTPQNSVSPVSVPNLTNNVKSVFDAIIARESPEQISKTGAIVDVFSAPKATVTEKTNQVINASATKSDNDSATKPTELKNTAIPAREKPVILNPVVQNANTVETQPNNNKSTNEKPVENSILEGTQSNTNIDNKKPSTIANPIINSVSTVDTTPVISEPAVNETVTNPNETKSTNASTNESNVAIKPSDANDTAKTTTKTPIAPLPIVKPANIQLTSNVSNERTKTPTQPVDNTLVKQSVVQNNSDNGKPNIPITPTISKSTTESLNNNKTSISDINKTVRKTPEVEPTKDVINEKEGSPNVSTTSNDLIRMNNNDKLRISTSDRVQKLIEKAKHDQLERKKERLMMEKNKKNGLLGISLPSSVNSLMKNEIRGNLQTKSPIPLPLPLPFPINDGEEGKEKKRKIEDNKENRGNGNGGDLENEIMNKKRKIVVEDKKGKNDLLTMFKQSAGGVQFKNKINRIGFKPRRDSKNIVSKVDKEVIDLTEE